MGFILLTFQRKNSRQFTSDNLNQDFSKRAIAEGIFGLTSTSLPLSFTSPQQQHTIKPNPQWKIRVFNHTVPPTCPRMRNHIQRHTYSQHFPVFCLAFKVNLKLTAVSIFSIFKPSINKELIKIWID